MATIVANKLVNKPRSASRRSLMLLAASVVLGLLHHTDHVLRADHSGWPFQPTVTPFTPSLGVYLLFLIAYMVRSQPAISAGIVTLVLILTQFSHLVFELPHDQYQTWENGSNSLHLHAPGLGAAAATLSIMLSVVIFSTVVSLVKDARHRGRGK